MIGSHDGVTYCRDALEKVLGEGRGRAWEGLNEGNASVGLLVASVEACNANGHYV